MLTNNRLKPTPDLEVLTPLTSLPHLTHLDLGESFVPEENPERMEARLRIFKKLPNLQYLDGEDINEKADEDDDEDEDDDDDDDEEEEVVEVPQVEEDQDDDEAEEDSVCQFTALNAGRADEVRLSETDSDSVPLEVRISESGSDGDEVVSLEAEAQTVVTLGSDSDEADSSLTFTTKVTTEIHGSSSSDNKFSNPFGVLLETREEQVQSREDAEAANALAMDMDERGEEGRRRGRVEEEERRRAEEARVSKRWL